MCLIQLSLFSCSSSCSATFGPLEQLVFFFGLHPMTAETISWMSEPKTLLASFFALLSLICYVSSVRDNGGGESLFTSVVAYLLALLSKPTAISMPLVMLLLDFWPLKRPLAVGRLVWSKIPFAVVGLLSGIVTYLSQRNTAGVMLPHEHGAYRIPLVVCHNIVFYFQKMLWPLSISPHYPFPEPFLWLQPQVLMGITGACIIIVLLVVSLRWTHAVVAGFSMFSLRFYQRCTSSPSRRKSLPTDSCTSPLAAC